MKIYFAHIKLIFLFALTQLLFISCNKESGCPATKEHTFYLTPSQKNYIPYLGTDTLTFIDQDGNKAIYYGQGRINDFQKYIDEADDCPPSNIT